MKDKIIQDSFGVDAGNISIVDLAYIESCGGLYGDCAKCMSKLVKLKPGKYKVKVKIDDCCVDSLEKDFILYTTGKVVIGDVCYLFSADEPSNKHWLTFLKKNKYLEKQGQYTYFVNTGGDGSFFTIVSFIKIGDEICMMKKKKNKNV